MKSFEKSEWTKFDTVHPLLHKCLIDGGFQVPTQIQSQILSQYKYYDNFLIASQTGSGKTLAFGVPILSSLLRLKERGEQTAKFNLKCLILAPTRELALQIQKHLNQINSLTLDQLRIIAIVGGISKEKQLRLLEYNPDVIIATPGRLWELIENYEHESLNFLNQIDYFVLDEADKIIQLGNFKELEKIIEKVYSKDIQSKDKNVTELIENAGQEKNLHTIGEEDFIELPFAEFQKQCIFGDKKLTNKMKQKKKSIQKYEVQLQNQDAANATKLEKSFSLDNQKHQEKEENEDSHEKMLSEDEKEEKWSAEENDSASSVKDESDQELGDELEEDEAFESKEGLIEDEGSSEELGNAEELDEAEIEEDENLEENNDEKGEEQEDPEDNEGEEGDGEDDTDPKLSKQRKLKIFLVSATLTKEFKQGKSKGKGGKHQPPQHNKSTHQNDLSEKYQSLMQKLKLQGKIKTIDLTSEMLFPEKLTEFKTTCVEEDKILYLYHYLQAKTSDSCIIFTNSISYAKKVYNQLQILGIQTTIIHSEQQQRQRLKNIDKFKEGKCNILISTDICARGIDIPFVKNVVHYQMPFDLDTYVHRCGRTARIGREGTSYLLIGPQDQSRYFNLCAQLQRDQGIQTFSVSLQDR